MPFKKCLNYTNLNFYFDRHNMWFHFHLFWVLSSDMNLLLSWVCIHIFILTSKLILNITSKFQENFKSIIGPLEEISSNSSSKTLKLQTEKYFLEVTIQKCSALEVESPTRQCCLGVIVKINFIYIICIYLRSLMILLVLVLWMSVYISRHFLY